MAGAVRAERRRFRMPTLGPENPLPTLTPPLENPYTISGDIPETIVAGSRFGHPATLYPYRMQDGYDRTLTERELETVVLENEYLRAVFLPGLGGRLWELFDKDAGKQLLHSPSAIRFANLGLRNAWFAGGVEWNIGTRGHSPTTCGPLHAAVLQHDGFEVLRMWEFERMRQVVFQIDAWLPAGSRVLLVAIRIRNPNAETVPMYWWSNAAVPQSADRRIVVPTETAFAGDYAGGIARIDPTNAEGVDATWPATNPRARDFFFDLGPQQRPWILTADRDGDGLALASSQRLRGRKLFVWGHGPGGRRWQEWLSGSEGEYAEIQAGLAQTQYEHLWMPTGDEWSWVEAYGNARVDAKVAHGGDWAAAVREGEERVGGLVSSEELEAAEVTAQDWRRTAPHRMLSVGTGWGALESARRRASRMPWVDETGTPFGAESITAQQQPWLDLLGGAGFSGAASDVAGTDWEERLAEVPGAAAMLHRAVLAHARGDLDAAARLYREVITFALAHRGLALIALAQERIDEAATEYRSACELQPDTRALLIEAASALVKGGRPAEALAMLDRADDATADHGRIRFLRALALARDGRRDEAAGILKHGLEVADLREGENSITALWREVCPGEPVPAAYQFSMFEPEVHPTE